VGAEPAVGASGALTATAGRPAQRHARAMAASSSSPYRAVVGRRCVMPLVVSSAGVRHMRMAAAALELSGTVTAKLNDAWAIADRGQTKTDVG